MTGITYINYNTQQTLSGLLTTIDGTINPTDPNLDDDNAIIVNDTEDTSNTGTGTTTTTKLYPSNAVLTVYSDGTSTFGNLVSMY